MDILKQLIDLMNKNKDKLKKLPESLKKGSSYEQDKFELLSQIEKTFWNWEKTKENYELVDHIQISWKNIVNKFSKIFDLKDCESPNDCLESIQSMSKMIRSNCDSIKSSNSVIMNNSDSFISNENKDSIILACLDQNDLHEDMVNLFAGIHDNDYKWINKPEDDYANHDVLGKVEYIKDILSEYIEIKKRTKLNSKNGEIFESHKISNEKIFDFS